MSLDLWDLERVDWASIETAVGNASGIPAALRGLANAMTIGEADRSYWMLDNVVVVQNTAFGAAPFVIPFAYAISCDGQRPAQQRALDLLIQLASAVDDDQPEVARRCREEFHRGLELAHRLTRDPDHELRQRAIWLLAMIEPDPERLRWLLEHVRALDPVQSNRDLAVRVLGADRRDWSIWR